MSRVHIEMDEIAPVQLTGEQGAIYNKMLRIMGYFFSSAGKTTVRPFRGFLIQGPPGSGKTEVALQVTKAMQLRMAKLRPPREVYLHFLDSSVIAAPHWGEAERKLANEFPTTAEQDERHVIIVDDIDCLMLTRGSEIAKEWHYSINSVMFHRLDNLDPTKVLMIATTNRPDLVDEALRSRLYTFTLPQPDKKEILFLAVQMANSLGLGADAQKIASSVAARLDGLSQPTLRNIQHFLIEECIESGLWG